MQSIYKPFDSEIHKEDLCIDTINKYGFCTFTKRIPIEKDYLKGEICAIDIPKNADMIVIASFVREDLKKIDSDFMVGQDTIPNTSNKADLLDEIPNFAFFPILKLPYRNLKLISHIFEDVYIKYAEITYIALENPLRTEIAKNNWFYIPNHNTYLIKHDYIIPSKILNIGEHEPFYINNEPVYILRNEQTKLFYFEDYCKIF